MTGLIFTGQKLKEESRAVWGNDWPSRLASILGQNRITFWRWSKKKTGHTRAVKMKLLTAAEEQTRISNRLVNILREDLGLM